MSIEAIQVLSNEVQLLKSLAAKALKAKSPLIKACADKCQQVETEINQLLSKAGVLADYKHLTNKKAALREDLDAMLAKIDDQVEQADNIVTYLNSRIESLRLDLKAKSEG